jgi:hypothetical protein
MSRRLQFSLRLLLVVVTALCIALGVWGTRAERQRRAVEAIWAAGGDVGYVRPKTSLHRWLPRDFFYEVEAVMFRHTEADVLVHIQGLENLNVSSAHRHEHHGCRLGSPGRTDEPASSIPLPHANHGRRSYAGRRHRLVHRLGRVGRSSRAAAAGRGGNRSAEFAVPESSTRS